MADGKRRMAKHIAAQLSSEGFVVYARDVNSVLFKEGAAEFEYDVDSYSYTIREVPSVGVIETGEILEIVGAEVEMAVIHYDRVQLQEQLLSSWKGNDFSLFRYAPRRWTGGTEATKLILDFKSGHPSAIEIVTEYTIHAFETLEKQLLGTFRIGYIASVPSSTAGGINKPCEQVCVALAKHFSWLTHVPDAFRRTQTVTKSAKAASIEERPTEELHKRTITYQGRPAYTPNNGWVLLDDVITHGRTSAACRTILQQATNCRPVAGFFISRTG